MGNRPSIMLRIVTLLVVGLAFIILASVFVPESSEAESGGSDRHGIEPVSTDPHESLHSLGTLEDDEYVIQVYATDAGPRYSVYDRADRAPLSVLITADQVAERYPELPLPGMDFDTPQQMMLAEPREGQTPR